MSLTTYSSIFSAWRRTIAGRAARAKTLSPRFVAVCAAALCGTALLCATPARADEIRLKDGNKLYGVIVAYEDNMFKVRTPFGYVLVEKDKIAEIVPESKPDPKAAKKDSAATAAKKSPAKAVHETAERDAPPPDAANAPDTSDAPPAVADAASNTEDSAAAKREKTAAIMANTAVKPQVPASAPKKVVAPAIRSNSAPVVTDASLVKPVPAPAAPKEPDTPPEEIHGNLYVNHANSFSIYKAPSWNLIEDARKALPNAIVAMGTQNESTLLVIGKEKTGKLALEPAADAVEHRVREVYENYRLISRRATTVDGQPGMEYRFRGVADDHDWSGALVVLTRGADTFTILGMTFAESDLIQIQENVISRAIASLKFTAQ